MVVYDSGAKQLADIYNFSEDIEGDLNQCWDSDTKASVWISPPKQAILQR